MTTAATRCSSPRWSASSRSLHAPSTPRCASLIVAAPEDASGRNIPAAGLFHANARPRRRTRDPRDPRVFGMHRAYAGPRLQSPENATVRRPGLGGLRVAHRLGRPQLSQGLLLRIRRAQERHVAAVPAAQVAERPNVTSTRALLAFLVATSSAGCVGPRWASASSVGCAPDDVEITEDTMQLYSRTWVATCHGSRYRCVGRCSNGKGRCGWSNALVTCRPAPVP